MKKLFFPILCISIIFLFDSCSNLNVDPKFEYEIENTADFEVSVMSSSLSTDKGYFSSVKLLPNSKTIIKTNSSKGLKFEVFFTKSNEYTYSIEENLSSKKYKIIFKSVFKEYTIENTSNVQISVSSKDLYNNEQYFPTITIGPNQKRIVKTKSDKGINIDLINSNDDYILVLDSKINNAYRLSIKPKPFNYSFQNTLQFNVIASSLDPKDSKNYFSNITIKPGQTETITVNSSSIYVKFSNESNDLTIEYTRNNRAYTIYNSYKSLVEYVVECTCNKADVFLTNDTGGSDSYSDVSIPFKKGFNKLPSDKFLYISGQSNEQGNKKITVSVYYKGILRKTSTSNGEYAIATASYSVN